MYFGEEYERILLELIDMRIEYKLRKFQGNKPNQGIKKEILIKKQLLKDQAENEILSRLMNYFQNRKGNPNKSEQK